MKRSLLVAPFAALVFLGAGCAGASEPSAVPNPDGTPAARVETGRINGATATSACAHPFFPLKNGYSITYANRYTGGTSNYSMTASNVDERGATMTIVYESGLRSEQRYTCSNGAVQATGYVDMAAGMSGASATAQTRSVEGELLPQNLRVGSRWNTRFVIAMQLGAVLPEATNTVGDTMNGTVFIQREAIAEEAVTVPAGTFRAIKVKAETDLRIDTGPGASPENYPPSVSYEWWVEGKGLVKTTMGGDQSIVSEATAIVLP